MSKDIWVISDTHFGHENIIRYCDRPFHFAREMDEYIRDRWNSVVKPEDKVYHLGDVYFNGGYKESPEYWLEFLNSLNGKKRLILGNHDSGKDQILLESFQKILMWRHWKFGKNNNLLMTHVPVHPSTLNSGDDGRTGLKNIHGHTHTNGEPKELTSNYKDKRYKCVCVELLDDYTPVHIEELL